MHGSRGFLGCCIKPPHIIAVDKPSKGLIAQGQRVNKASLTEDFWSTSTCEMDNSAVQSQRSVSSISTFNQTIDPHSSAGSNPPEFVNSGLLLWNHTRQQWIGNKGSQKRIQAREPRLSWNATYESLLGTSKPFRQRIPLPVSPDFWRMSFLCCEFCYSPPQLQSAYKIKESGDVSYRAI